MQKVVNGIVLDVNLVVDVSETRLRGKFYVDEHTFEKSKPLTKSPICSIARSPAAAMLCCFLQRCNPCTVEERSRMSCSSVSPKVNILYFASHKRKSHRNDLSSSDTLYLTNKEKTIRSLRFKYHLQRMCGQGG